MASRSFFSPRSTVKATTSHPCSASQRMATEVSSPPEYASTTFLLMIEQVPEGAAGFALAKHGDDRVVAGHGTRHTGKRGLVDATGHQVRGPGRRPDHGQRLDQLDREHELTDEGRGAAI